MKKIENVKLVNIPILEYIKIQNLCKKYKSNVVVEIFISERSEDHCSCWGHSYLCDLKTVLESHELIFNLSDNYLISKYFEILIDGEDEEKAYEEINDYLINQNKNEV